MHWHRRKERSNDLNTQIEEGEDEKSHFSMKRIDQKE